MRARVWELLEGWWWQVVTVSAFEGETDELLLSEFDGVVDDLLVGLDGDELCVRDVCDLDLGDNLVELAFLELDLLAR